MIGLLETKVKDKNVDKVAGKAFPGLFWLHNFEHDAKGRIWIAWKPSYVTQLST